MTQATEQLSLRSETRLQSDRIGDRIDASGEFDPATYEIVRHRMWSMADDMATVLKRMSGSPIVSEANDFNFVISNAAGATVQLAQYNLELGVSTDLAIEWIMERRGGFKSGDMFFTNDPWVGGGLHQSDCSIMQPIFWEGELICWTSVVLHVIDIGGIEAGSFTVSAKDVYAEASPTPPIKYVEDGQIRVDVEDLLLRQSRVPGFLALDLRAAYSANLAGRREIERLLKVYGKEVVKSAMNRMLDDAEEQLRQRLKKLPDGKWAATHYLDSAGAFDRSVNAIRLEMSKIGDKLVFDFTDSDAQNGMINCTGSGARGGIASALLPVMAGDMPWALGGLMRCVEVVTKPGTVVDATFPGAVSKAPIAAAMSASNAAVETLSKMLDSDAVLRNRALAAYGGSAAITNFVGTKADGTPFLGGLWEGAMIGMGARTDGDGLSAAGWLAVIQGRVADVEAQELFTPMLYLWRRLEPDSGGPGLYRGGRAGSSCVIPHKVRGPMQFVISSSGKGVPQNPGLAGGYPGSTQKDVFYRASGARAAIERGEIPASAEELGGTPYHVTVHEVGVFNEDDAFTWITQGGGGYMDPLLRDPEAVATDVRIGAVLPETASDIYGVLLDKDGLVDLDGTRSRRAQIRRDRAKAAGISTDEADRQSLVEGVAQWQRVDENCDISIGNDGGEVLRCRHCESTVSVASSPAGGLAVFEEEGSKGGPQVAADPNLFVDGQIVFRQLVCPSCFVAFTSEVVPASHRIDVPEVSPSRDFRGS